MVWPTEICIESNNLMKLGGSLGNVPQK
jgi:hypothetical protein